MRSALETFLVSSKLFWRDLFDRGALVGQCGNGDFATFLGE